MNDDEVDIYECRDGSSICAEYTVYVDVGEMEDKFKAFVDSSGYAIEATWIDRHWK